MRTIREAYAAFWGGFLDRSVTPHRQIPSFPAGYVVFRDAQGRPIPEVNWTANMWPYITHRPILTPFNGETITDASVWDRPPNTAQNPFARVDDVLEQVREAVGAGVILDVAGRGSIYIRPSNPMFDYLDEPDDAQITRGIIRLIVANT